MKRVELLIEDIQRSCESQLNSSGGGISPEEILSHLKSAQDNLYREIVSRTPDVMLTETFVDLVANQESYPLPTDLHLGTSIKHLWYKWGQGASEYRILESKPLHMRLSGVCSSPAYFYIRNNDKILINPIPSENLTAGVRLAYQKKLRNLDIRRGVISEITKSGSTLLTIKIDLTPALGKDSGTVAAAKSMLNKADRICVVYKDGSAFLNNIPIDSYDSSTGIITIGEYADGTAYTTAYTQPDFVDLYIVSGDFSTTHCDLPDDTIESYLKCYVKQCLLRRQGNPDEVSNAVSEMQALFNSILSSYETPDQDLKHLEPDESWGGSSVSYYPSMLGSGGSGGSSVSDTTASNVGTTGVGPFKVKVGSDLRFKNAASAVGSPIIVTDNIVRDTVDFDWALLGLEDLTDPGSDKIFFWDDSAGASKFLTLGLGLSITDTTLNAASSSLGFTADSGTATPSSDNLNIVGNSGQGVSSSGSGSTITLTVANATTSTKGVSSFSTTNFTVSSGAVSSKDITFTAGTGLTGGGTATLGGSVSFALTTPVSVSNGGQGANTQTNHGVLIGQGTSPVTATTAGTSGQHLQSQGASTDPIWTSTTYPSTSAQGDLLYGSASNTLSSLAKDTNATRYLSNTGTSNSPAWAQINLTNGVTGTLPVSNGGTGVASTTAYAVLCGGTTSTSALQSIASVGTSGQVLTSNGAGALPTFQASGGTSYIVKQVRANTSTGGSTATNIPADDTIPQSGEGAEILTATITPASATNILMIEWSFYMTAATSSGATVTGTSALFQDSTANALYAQSDFVGNSIVANSGTNVYGRYYMVAGTTSATTFKLRAGMDSGTYYWLSYVGSGRYSTSDRVQLTITEIIP